MRARAVPSRSSRLTLVMVAVAVGGFVLGRVGEAAPEDRRDAALRETLAHLHTVPFEGLADGSIRYEGVTVTWHAGAIQDGMRTVTVVTSLDRGGRSGPGSEPHRTTAHRFAGRG